MAYRLTYDWTMSWIGPGQGPSGTMVPSALGPGAGNAQAISAFNSLGTSSVAPGQTIAGTGTGGILQAADITTLTNAMAADVSAQLNAQPMLGQLQGWASGQP